MFYDDDLGTENIFPPVCLISEYASFTINVYLYSIHLGIWNVTAVFQFPFKEEFSLSEYRLQMDASTCQFKSSFLKLNTTKELPDAR